jgi:undecaprenyl-diphosphatase
MSRLKSPLQQISRWDVELCILFNRQSRNVSVRGLFRGASRLGDGVFWYALMAALLLHFRGEALPAVLHMLAAAAVGTALYKLIKHKTLRPRPFRVHPDIACAGKILDQFSFPSGHTMHATSFSVIVLYYFPGLVWLVAPFSVMVALSRPILGLHYPSDVLAGAAMGGILAACTLYVA